VEACRELKADFAFVPAEHLWSVSALKALGEADVAPFWAVSGPLWPVIECYGVAEGLRATLTHPDEIAQRLDDRIADIRHLVAVGLDLGARAIVIAEDLAGSEGPLIAPDFAIEVLLPRLAGLVGFASASSVPVVLHSDGDIRLLLPAIARAGFSGVHAGGGLDADGFERLYHAARKEGLMVIGGMQTTELSHGPLAAIALGSRVGVLARLGGLLLADDGGLTQRSQVTALVSALAAARDA